MNEATERLFVSPNWFQVRILNGGLNHICVDAVEINGPATVVGLFAKRHQNKAEGLHVYTPSANLISNDRLTPGTPSLNSDGLSLPKSYVLITEFLFISSLPNFSSPLGCSDA